ncbi:MAG: SDR family oxidoreductase [Rhodococcus sp. (in: high G+C Gram-positive bacteria)]
MTGGRVVLITGGSRGIGAGVARVFAANGDTVLVCSRRPAGDDSAESLICDVRDPAHVESMMQAIVSRHGRLDVLINNAGGGPYALAADAGPELHRKIIDLNLLAPLTVAVEANAVMQTQEVGGVVVMISSVSGGRPSPGTAAYGAAKAGIDSLTKSLAVEWAPRVRVNSISIGMVRTESSAQHYGDDATVRAIEATIPLERMADTEEVGHAALYLSSPLAGYVSGSSLLLHGGGEKPAFLSAGPDHRKENTHVSGHKP